MRKIAFDIDGVVLDPEPVFNSEFIKRYNFDIIKDRYDYNIDIPGVTPEEVHDTIYYCLEHRYKEIPRTRFSTIILKYIYELYNEPIIFVTSRNSIIKEPTIQSLNDHFGNYIEFKIIFNDDKKKVFINHLKERGYCYFVEDNIDFANSVSDVIDRCFLINKYHNIKYKSNDNVFRVKDLKQAFLYYKKFENERNNKKI